MEGARVAALAAVALGGFAMVINFMALPMLMTKVSKLHADMQVGMQSFKAMTDQAWDEMMHIRRLHLPNRAVRDADYDAGSGSSGAVLFPYGYAPQPSAGSPSAVEYQQQQAWDQFGYSSASSGAVSLTASFSEDAGTTKAFAPAFDNGCPAGPSGPPGDPGKDGSEGAPGQDGLPGQAAHEMKFEDLDMCSICPGGPKGPAGPAGPTGLPGKKGVLGEPGKHGANGTVGASGPAGKKGFQGLPGKPGGKGKSGKPAPGGKGKPGPKGATGPIGRAGPQGPPGNSSTLNNGTGPTGLHGALGLNGIPGKTGQRGPPGTVGIAGGEGGYCPCPKELKNLGLASANATIVPPTPAAAAVTTSAAPIPAAPPAVGPLDDATSTTTLAPQSPLAGYDQGQTSAINFGGLPPGFGPPGSSFASSGGGIVALPPASGGVDGAMPPSGQQPGSQGATGELNNVLQLPRQ